MKKPTKKEIKINNLELEMFMNEPLTILWSIIEELKDIHEFYLSNLFNQLKYNKKAKLHLIHQIERLEYILQYLDKQKEIDKNIKFENTTLKDCIKYIKGVAQENLEYYQKNSTLNGYELILDAIQKGANQ